MQMSSFSHRILALVCAAGILGTAPLSAETTQPYAGQEAREISTLSADDIEALLGGEGWGLAKPAELNGWPGPRHILDLQEDLNLSQDQIAAIQSIFDAMNAKARDLGVTLIEAERALDAAFESNDISAATLDALLAQAESARTQLRAVHLAVHLEATPILTRHQRMQYATLRGYGGTTNHSGHGDH